jgi:hypothetical protein
VVTDTDWPYELVVNRREYERLVHERGLFLQALWECYVASGADTDGDQGPEALMAGMGAKFFAKGVVGSVQHLQDDYRESLEEGK